MLNMNTLGKLVSEEPDVSPGKTEVKQVLKRVSFGSKDCTKELKLECAYFLDQTS